MGATPEQRLLIMKRIVITKNEGKGVRWFNADQATMYPGCLYFLGKIAFSKSTDSTESHESLYLTKHDTWILREYDTDNLSRASYSVISKNEAAKWFVKNEYEDKDIPFSVLDNVMNLEL